MLAASVVGPVDEALEPTLNTVERLYEGFLANLPLIVIAILLAVAGIVIVFSVASFARTALERTRADPVAVDFTVRILRLFGIVAALLAAFAIAGVEVGPALAGLGLAGLAVAFAVQAILENFIAGIILLVRRPFRAGDQIRTGDFEGTIQEVLLTEFGESGVIFEVRYGTAPDIGSVRFTQDRVLSAAKTAIEEGGMTIPWPVRTLLLDTPVPIVREPESA